MTPQDLSLFDAERLARRELLAPPNPRAMVPARLVPDGRQVLARRGPPRTRSLTAAASRVVTTDERIIRDLRILRGEGWQSRAWDAYRYVDEIHDTLNFVADLFTRIRVVPSILDNKREPVPSEDTGDWVLLDDLDEGLKRGGMDGVPAALHDMGLHLNVPGESYLVGTTDEQGRNTWDIASPDELEFRGSELYRVRAPGITPEVLPAEAFLLRVWRPDPRYSFLATSPLKGGMLDRAEELMLLSDSIMAAALSRSASAGIFAVPDEASLPALDDDEDEDPLTADLLKAFTTAIRDKRSAAAVVPVVLRMKGEHIDKLKHITFDRPMDEKDMERRRELIERIAHGLPVPPEIVTGMGDANHWTSWQIAEETWARSKPTLILILDALTRGWYQPRVEAQGRNSEGRLLWFDDTDITTRPNKMPDANKGHDSLLISDAAWRREAGFADEDAPGEQERLRRVGVLLRDVGLATTGDAAQSTGPAPGSPIGMPSTPRPAGPDTVRTGPPPVDGVTAAAGRSLDRLASRLGDLDRRLFDRLAVGADAVVRRALERAGARLRSRVNGSGDLRAVARSVGNFDLAATLGRARVATLGLEEDALLAGAVADFELRAEEWLRSAQEGARSAVVNQIGLDGEQAEAVLAPQEGEARRAAILILGAALSAYAAARLYDPRPTPPPLGELDDLLAPRQILRDAMAIAGGGNARTAAATGGGGIGAGTGGGIGDGVGSSRFTQTLLADGGVQVVGRVWSWGGSARPFDPHLALDGVEFADWEDPRLATPPGYEWIGSPYLSPGDHRGCSCAAFTWRLVD